MKIFLLCAALLLAGCATQREASYDRPAYYAAPVPCAVPCYKPWYPNPGSGYHRYHAHQKTKRHHHGR